MKTTRRYGLTAWLLAAVMLITSLPATALAAEPADFAETVSKGEYIVDIMNKEKDLTTVKSFSF